MKLELRDSAVLVADREPEIISYKNKTEYQKIFVYRRTCRTFVHAKSTSDYNVRKLQDCFSVLLVLPFK